VRALARFRKENPDFANANIVEIMEDSGRRLVFQKGKYSVVIDGTECRVTNNAGSVVFRDMARTGSGNRF
jgi:hypothetical protein